MKVSPKQLHVYRPLTLAVGVAGVQFEAEVGFFSAASAQMTFLVPVQSFASLHTHFPLFDTPESLPLCNARADSDTESLDFLRIAGLISSVALLGVLISSKCRQSF